MEADNTVIASLGVIALLGGCVGGAASVLFVFAVVGIIEKVKSWHQQRRR